MLQRNNIQKCLKAKTTISVFEENFLNNNNYHAR